MTNQILISQLQHDGYLKTPNILEAFEKVDRKNFVRESERELAYKNSALPIGHGQTISQPLVVAFMLELLQPKKGEKIFDIGAGSGWAAALLAEIIGAKGKVIAMERIPELADMARKNIAKYKRLMRHVEIREGDGAKGCETEAPFDKIIAAASAKQIPVAWKRELKQGGTIVAPIGESIVHLEKTGEKTFKKREFFGFRFVPLITALSTERKI